MSDKGKKEILERLKKQGKATDFSYEELYGDIKIIEKREREKTNEIKEQLMHFQFT